MSKSNSNRQGDATLQLNVSADGRSRSPRIGIIPERKIEEEKIAKQNEKRSRAALDHVYQSHGHCI